jgi:hypothetical protein
MMISRVEQLNENFTSFFCPSPALFNKFLVHGFHRSCKGYVALRGVQLTGNNYIIMLDYYTI